MKIDIRKLIADCEIDGHWAVTSEDGTPIAVFPKSPSYLTLKPAYASITGEEVYRKIISNFLSRFPSANPYTRMRELNELLRSFQIEATRHNQKAEFDKCRSEFHVRYLKISDGAVSSVPMWNRANRYYGRVRAEYSFSERERYHRRFEALSALLRLKASSFMALYSKNIAKIKDRSFCSRKSGVHFDFNQNTFICHNESTEVRRIRIERDGHPLDFFSDKVVLISGVQHCCIGVIEKEIGETFLISVLNRNFKSIGYLCASPTSDACFAKVSLGKKATKKGEVQVRMIHAQFGGVVGEVAPARTEQKALANFLSKY